MKVTIYSTTLANYNRIAPTLLETSFSTAIPLEIIYEAPDTNPQITPKQPWEWKFWQYENWNLPDFLGERMYSNTFWVKWIYQI